jgi:hypothetical protein
MFPPDASQFTILASLLHGPKVAVGVVIRVAARFMPGFIVSLVGFGLPRFVY